MHQNFFLFFHYLEIWNLLRHILIGR